MTTPKVTLWCSHCDDNLDIYKGFSETLEPLVRKGFRDGPTLP
jgi:hypothetical protein